MVVLWGMVFALGEVRDGWFEVKSSAERQRRNRRGLSDRAGCAFDSQTGRLLEKAACPEGKLGYPTPIGGTAALVEFPAGRELPASPQD